MNHPVREDVINRKLNTPMQALQAAYELLELHYFSPDFALNGEAGELTARVMADLWRLAQTQLEAK